MMKKEKNIVCLQNEKIRLKQKERSKSGQTLHAIRIQKQNVVHNGMVMKSHSVIGEAESAQDILDWFDEIGLKDYMSIELHEQWRFHSYYDQSDKELVYKDY